MVGTALITALKREGYDVLRLVRRHGNFDEPQIGWEPARGVVQPEELEGLDAVVHLAGESIGGGLWTEERKRRIHDSRSIGTRHLAEALAGLKHPPQTLVCASAVGYYGDRGAEPLTEVSGSGEGFLARVCRDWETATRPAAEKGIRVVNTRFGVILSGNGGMLKAVRCPLKLGLAGQLGNGRQYFSWVALDDVVGAILHVLSQPEIRGPVNVAAPQETTNAEFTDAMRKTLIPAFLPTHYWTPPAPALLLKLLPGGMGSELLLASQRVRPVRLQETGYVFKHPDLKQTLEAVL
jgi:uncharacterized protein (TIGR01777 family)